MCKNKSQAALKFCWILLSVIEVSDHADTNSTIGELCVKLLLYAVYFVNVSNETVKIIN